MINEKWIRRTVIELSQYLLFRRFFLFLYKIQLKLIVAVFRKEAGISAIILRRKGVLEDAYPGDSDYDITCVINADADSVEGVLSGCAKRQRYLKRICPVLGETKFVNEADLSTHLECGFVNYYAYYDNICFLYKRNDFTPKAPKRYSLISVYQKILHLLMDFIWHDFFIGADSGAGNKTVFSRPVYKIKHKIKWLADFVNTRKLKELDYKNLEKQPLMLPLSMRDKILRECVDMARGIIPIKSDSDDIPFAVEGENELLPQNFIDNMQDIFNPLISEFGNLLEKIILCNYRLYKTRKILLIKSKGNITPGNKFCAAMRKCSKNLAPYRRYLDAAYPLPLDDSLWKFVMTAEPITKVLYEHEHYDFIKPKRVQSLHGYVAVAREVLYADIAGVLDMIYSAIRPGYTAYFLDLLFGQLIANNLLLQTGVLYASFEKLEMCYLSKLDLNKRQREIIDIYRRGDSGEIERIKILDAWHIFKDLCLSEINKARMVLSPVL